MDNSRRQCALRSERNVSEIIFTTLAFILILLMLGLTAYAMLDCYHMFDTVSNNDSAIGHVHARNNTKIGSALPLL